MSYAKPWLRSEKEVTRGVKKVLRNAHIWHFKHFSSMGSAKGVPDIIGIRQVSVRDLVEAGIDKVGIFVGIELKREGLSKLKGNPDQERFLANVRDNHGIGFVTDNEQDVIEKLGLFKRLFPLLASGKKKDEKIYSR